MRNLYYIILLFGLEAAGQNFSKDIRELNIAHGNVKKTVTITSRTITDGKVKETRTITINSKSIDEYYLNAEDTKMLIRDGLKIVINEELKVIMIDSNRSSDLANMPMQLFDSMPNYYSSIKHGTRDDRESYVLTPKVGPTNKIEIYFHRVDMLLTDVLVEVKEAAENISYILHNEYKYSDVSSSDIPMISDFFNSKTNQPTTQYQDYEIINYL